MPAKWMWITTKSGKTAVKVEVSNGKVTKTGYVYRGESGFYLKVEGVLIPVDENILESLKTIIGDERWRGKQERQPEKQSIEERVKKLEESVRSMRETFDSLVAELKESIRKLSETTSSQNKTTATQGSSGRRGELKRG